MSRKGILVSGSQALTSNTARTVLQVTAAANHAVRLISLNIGTTSEDNTNQPIKVQLIRQSNDGSGSSSVTITKADNGLSHTFDATGKSGFTSEPTSGDVIFETTFHPQAGLTMPFHAIGLDLVVHDATICGVVLTSKAALNAFTTLAIEE